MSVPQRQVLSAKDRKAMLLVLFVVTIGAVVGGMFLLDYVSELRARKQLLAVIAESASVTMNGEKLADPAVVLSALRGLTHVPAHHSAPGRPIHIEVQGRPDTISIILARDSERPQEFWVYRAGANWNRDPLGQDAGRIVSAKLDQLMRARRI